MKEIERNIKKILEDEMLSNIAYELWVSLYANINKLKDDYAKNQTIKREIDIWDIVITLKLKK